MFGSGRDPGSGDRALHWAPCREPASPSAYVSASLSVSLMNKYLKKKKKKEQLSSSLCDSMVVPSAQKGNTAGPLVSGVSETTKLVADVKTWGHD